jgi:hypothetical protein
VRWKAIPAAGILRRKGGDVVQGLKRDPPSTKVACIVVRATPQPAGETDTVGSDRHIRW